MSCTKLLVSKKRQTNDASSFFNNTIWNYIMSNFYLITSFTSPPKNNLVNLFGKTHIHSVWVIPSSSCQETTLFHSTPWANEKYLKKYPLYSLVLFLELWRPSVERFEKHLFQKKNTRGRKKIKQKKKEDFFYKKRSFKNKFKEKKEVLRSCDLKCSDSN